MKLKSFFVSGIIIALFICSCTSTRYLTDPTSIGRQHDMKKHRTGVNAGDIILSFVNLFISGTLDTEYEMSQSERAFKRITVENESSDTLFVNMVTDIVWKETGYCDIMGIVLPPGKKQRLLAPYPAAYNVYFRTNYSDEEKIEFRTDSKHRKITLRANMTEWLEEEDNQTVNPDLNSGN
ncbi:MAG: hypothetical protein WAO52_06625 [Prolixibacteraceae bacterium]